VTKYNTYNEECDKYEDILFRMRTGNYSSCVQHYILNMYMWYEHDYVDVYED